MMERVSDALQHYMNNWTNVKKRDRDRDIEIDREENRCLQQPVKRFEDSILLAVRFRKRMKRLVYFRVRIIPCYSRRGDPRPPCKPEEDHPHRCAYPEPEIHLQVQHPHSRHVHELLPSPLHLLCNNIDPCT